MYKTKEIEQIIREAISKSKSMAEASSKTTMNFKTFRKYAKEFHIYLPNPTGKGIYKPRMKGKTSIEDILKGLHPEYQTFKLAKRLLKDGIKSHICEICNLTDWNNRPIPLELDHIDGNPYNHVNSNIRLICPNCHAQTSTYRGKNKKGLDLSRP